MRKYNKLVSWINDLNGKAATANSAVVLAGISETYAATLLQEACSKGAGSRFKAGSEWIYKFSRPVTKADIEQVLANGRKSSAASSARKVEKDRILAEAAETKNTETIAEPIILSRSTAVQTNIEEYMDMAGLADAIAGFLQNNYIIIKRKS